MLNMAHTMKEEFMLHKNSQQELTLQFLFFDGEEAFQRWTSTDSIYGSRALAKAWEGQSYSYGGVSGNNLDRIDMFLLLDLIGAKGMTFSKLETSTGDWYDNLVRIERRLQDRSIIQGRDIFKVGISETVNYILTAFIFSQTSYQLELKTTTFLSREKMFQSFT